MDQENHMSSINKSADGSSGGHHGNSGNPVTTIAQIDPIAVGETRSITNITSSSIGAQQLSAGDLEALANIQEELDRIAQVPNPISNQAETHDDEQGVVGVQEGLTEDTDMTDVGTTGVTHAMITADGRAVPITIHPETGAYMTPDGQTLVTQEVDGQQVVVASTGEPEGILPSEQIEPTTTTTIFPNARPDTSDLSSLAAAAETHQVMDTSSGNAIPTETEMEVDTLRTGHLDHVPVVGDFPPENILSSVSSTNQNSSTTHFVTLPSEINAMEEEGASYQTATGQTIRIVKKDNTNLGTTTNIQNLENSNIRIINTDGTTLNTSGQNVLHQANTNIRVMNSDGTFSNLQNLQSNLPQGLRIVNSDGTLMQLGGGGAQLQTSQQIYQPIQEEPQQQVQQIRIVNSDGTVTLGNTIRTQPIQQAQPQVLQQTVLPQQTQIKILNSDGTLSSLDNSNIRIVQQPSPPQQPKVRIVHSGGGAVSTGGSPIKTTMTLQQAQQMGLIPQNTISTLGSTSSGTNNVKILPKSPTKTIRTNDGRTIVLAQSPQKQQVVIKSGTTQKVVQGIANNQQVLRIPTSSSAVSPSGNVNVGQLQKIQIGNKIQYVRVIPSGGQKLGSQTTSVRQTQPILPSTTKGANSSSAPISLKAMSATGPQQVVKIALPSNYQQQPGIQSATKTYSGAVSQQKTLQSAPKHILPANAAGRAIAKLEVDANTGALIADQNVQLAEGTHIESEDLINHVEQNDEKTIKQNQGLERLDSLSSSNLNQGERRDSNSSAQVSFEASGVRPKKPCNCTKSACLKLYCDCFANGEFCNNCNCNNCFNNLAHEKQRQKAIKQCLDRNPSAFKPKIGRQGNETDRRHNRGCNCKRSGCLKNYCECYEAKIPCHEACKCIGCKNVDEDASGGGMGEGGLGSNSTTSSFGMLAAHRRNEIRPSLKAKLAPLNALQSGGGKQPFSFVTSDVVEATTQCLLAQAEETERSGKHSQVDIESMIIEEFGRCLGQIIEMANKAGAASNGTGDPKTASKAITADS